MILRSIFLAVFAVVVQTASADNSHCAVNLDFTKRYLASEESVRLCDAYPDTVLLVVNTASYCGFTSQFEGLEALQEKYGDRGFSVLGFPSNDFFQDPRSEEKIREFCVLTYEVKFPMFEKSRVAKRSAEPLFQALAAEAGQFPRWNFHKYLLNRQGEVVGSFGSSIAPNNAELVSQIEALL